MTDHTNFTNLIQASPTLASRWSELAQKAISDARELGVQIDENSVLDLREVRNAALGAPLDEEDYRREMMTLPALSDVARKAAIADGDEDARAAAVAELDKITTDAAHARSTDARARKLARARDLGVTTARVGEADDRNEKLRLLSEMSDHQARLKMARKWGLL